MEGIGGPNCAEAASCGVVMSSYETRVRLSVICVRVCRAATGRTRRRATVPEQAANSVVLYLATLVFARRRTAHTEVQYVLEHCAASLVVQPCPLGLLELDDTAIDIEELCQLVAFFLCITLRFDMLLRVYK